MGLFPAFINVSEVTIPDVLSIMVVAAVAFGSVNVGYALLAFRAKKMLKSQHASSIINKTAGTIMISTGAFVAVKS